MIGCLVLAFQLCNPNGGYYAAQQVYAQPVYAQQVYAQPSVVYVVPAQPIYVAQPVYGYGGGISVNVGRHGGARVRCC